MLKKKIDQNMYFLEQIINYFLIKTRESYFSYKDLLHRLNVYKISTKGHQVVDFLVIYQLAASKILL